MTYTTSGVLSNASLPSSVTPLIDTLFGGSDSSSSSSSSFRGNIRILLLLHSIVVDVKVQMITSHTYGTKKVSLSVKKLLVENNSRQTRREHIGNIIYLRVCLFLICVSQVSEVTRVTCNTIGIQPIWNDTRFQL